MAWNTKRRAKKKERLAKQLAEICTHIGYVQAVDPIADGIAAVRVQYCFDRLYDSDFSVCRTCKTVWSDDKIKQNHEAWKSKFLSDFQAAKGELLENHRREKYLAKKAQDFGRL